MSSHPVDVAARQPLVAAEPSGWGMEADNPGGGDAQKAPELALY